MLIVGLNTSTWVESAGPSRGERNLRKRAAKKKKNKRRRQNDAAGIPSSSLRGAYDRQTHPRATRGFRTWSNAFERVLVDALCTS
eukprot:6583813-Pyramimonas_sp.AAC.1